LVCKTWRLIFNFDLPWLIPRVEFLLLGWVSKLLGHGWFSNLKHFFMVVFWRLVFHFLFFQDQVFKFSWPWLIFRFINILASMLDPREKDIHMFTNYNIVLDVVCKCASQVDHIHILIFVNKSWPCDPCIKCLKFSKF
jgi:hypothetical protein